MKKIIIILCFFLTNSLLISQESMLVFGLNRAILEGDDIDDLDDVDILNDAYSIGFETNNSSSTVGWTYTRRGMSYEYDYIDTEIDAKYDYVTIYFLYPLSKVKVFSDIGVSILAGAEIGYFLKGEMDIDDCNDYQTTDEYGNTDSLCDDLNMNHEDWDNADGNFIDFGPLIAMRYSLEKISLTVSYYYGIPELWDDFEGYHRGYKFSIGFGI